VALIGLVPIAVHRVLLEHDNLLAAPKQKDPLKRPKPTSACPYRPDDGFGTDIDHPTTAMSMGPVGRNMPAIPKYYRDHKTGPDGNDNVQVIAQRLLAREGFKPAGNQLNIIAAAWIQAQVHSWIQHLDGAPTSIEATAEAVGPVCPVKKMNFFETEERPDGEYNSFRTQWWDASFVYGQNREQVHLGRLYKDGKLKVNESNPDTLSFVEEGKSKIDVVGDQSNSWVGVTVLQVLFIKEHNYCAEMIKKENPQLTDEEIYGHCRNIISALVAKIHTIDWTVELLKTEQLRVAMEINWKGATKAVFGDKAPFHPLRLINKPKADNKGVPFCLTEEFAAVYRLHPLLPPGLVVEHGEGKEEFIGIEKLLTTKGRDKMREPGMAKKIMFSAFHYSCGHLKSSNYPFIMRKFTPTDHKGVDLQPPEDRVVDMAAIDLHRDRERGIQKYNEFRRQLKLRPFKTWEALTGEENKSDNELTDAKKLELIYGPAPEGIEKIDLLVGDLYEGKIADGFALSETSFMIFLLMASRRIDSDPYLNEYYNEEYYTKWGFKHVEETSSLKEVLNRHYPELGAAFPEGHSAFKPIYPQEKWKDAETLDGFKEVAEIWNETKKDNENFFKNLMNAS